MDRLTDDVFPRFTLEGNIHFSPDFVIPLQSLLARSVTAEEYLQKEADLFENSSTYKRKRNEDSGRDYKERRLKDRGYAINEMNLMSDKDFKKMFRLKRRAFYYLLSLIKKHISPSKSAVDPIYYHETLTPIPEQVRLAVTLRWLAGGSYLDICFAFGISLGTFLKEKLVYYTLYLLFIL